MPMPIVRAVSNRIVADERHSCGRIASGHAKLWRGADFS